jgi:hypothetical protein
MECDPWFPPNVARREKCTCIIREYSATECTVRLNTTSEYLAKQFIINSKGNFLQLEIRFFNVISLIFFSVVHTE